MRFTPSCTAWARQASIGSYLVEDGEAIAVVDAGLPGHWNDLLRELEAIGRSPADIKALLLTHGDTDHVGFAERLGSTYGVPVFVGAADADELAARHKPSAPRDSMRLRPLAGFLVYGLTKGGVRRMAIEEVTEIVGATTLDVPDRQLSSPLPGHTPGSVAYHVPMADAIFMGDAMTTRSVVTGVVGPALGPFTVDPYRRPRRSAPSMGWRPVESCPATAILDRRPARSPPPDPGASRAASAA